MTEAAEATDEKMQDAASFELSASLPGHVNPLRTVAVASNSQFATGGSKGDFIVWNRQDSGEFTGSQIFETQPAHNLTFCCQHYKDDVFLSGGNTFSGEGEMIMWRTSGEIVARINHPQAVISVSANSETSQCTTGSFDEKGRIFNLNSSGKMIQLGNHKYGVESCLLDSAVITGSYKDINIWDHSGNLVKTLKLAHDHQIRRVIPHPLGFASCGNDGYIRVWSKDGEKLMEIWAHPEVGDKPSFVYAITAHEDGRIASCAEDGSVKIWSADGSLLQAISFPAVVRDLRWFPNGDILTGSTDSTVRIFTTNPERYASETERINFQELVEMANSGMKEIDDSAFESEEALNQPGEEGQVKLVKTSRGPMAYQYSNGSWVEIGHALGAASGDSRPQINGVHYDYVTDIYLDETNVVKLGMNKDDDPKKVLHDFSVKYAITDGEHRRQILAHLNKMVDPVARAKRMEAEAIAARNRLLHIPIHKRYRAHLFAESKLQKMEDAVMNNNIGLVDTEFYIKPEQLQQVFAIVKDTAHYHSSAFPDSCRRIVRKMAKTPTEKILPILDFLRVLMLHNQAVTMMDDQDLRQTLISHMTNAVFKPVGRRLVCELLANYLNKRNASPAEDPELIPFLQSIVTETSSLAGEKKAPYLRGYTAFMTNLLIWMGRFNCPTDGIAEDVAASLSHALASIQNPKFQFFALLNVGTIMFLSEDTKDIIVASAGGLDAFKESVRGMIRADGANAQAGEVSEDLWKMLG